MTVLSRRSSTPLNALRGMDNQERPLGAFEHTCGDAAKPPALKVATSVSRQGDQRCAALLTSTSHFTGCHAAGLANQCQNDVFCCNSGPGDMEIAWSVGLDLLDHGLQIRSSVLLHLFLRLV